MTVIELLQYNPSVLIIFCTVLGLLVGSFLNVVIYRVPVMLQREWRQQCCEFLELDESTVSKEGTAEQHKVFNLVKPDSHCPKCNAPVRAWQNIPIISYLFLRGRCNACKTPISIRYPIIEAVTGLLSALVAWQFGATALTLALLVLTWCLVCLTMIDFDHQLLPDNITIPLLWLGLLVNTLLADSGVSPRDALIGAALGYLSLWGVYWVFKLLTGKEGMGYGDFKLLAAIGAWVGWQHLPVVILLSSFVGAVVGVTLLTVQGKDKSHPIPFGPYLAAAGWLTLLYGDWIVTQYWQWMLP